MLARKALFARLGAFAAPFAGGNSHSAYLLFTTENLKRLLETNFSVLYRGILQMDWYIKLKADSMDMPIPPKKPRVNLLIC